MVREKQLQLVSMVRWLVPAAEERLAGRSEQTSNVQSDGAGGRVPRQEKVGVVDASVRVPMQSNVPWQQGPNSMLSQFRTLDSTAYVMNTQPHFLQKARAPFRLREVTVKSYPARSKPGCVRAPTSEVRWGGELANGVPVIGDTVGGGVGSATVAGTGEGSEEIAVVGSRVDGALDG